MVILSHNIIIVSNRKWKVNAWKDLSGENGRKRKDPPQTGWIFFGGAAGIRYISASRKLRFRSVEPSRVTVHWTVTFNCLNPFLQKNTHTPNGVWGFLAEQQGFEPWRHFHALRDFESRLFDQLEYCSVFTTGLLYQPKSGKSSGLSGSVCGQL